MYNKTMFVLAAIMLTSTAVMLLGGCGESGVEDHSGVPVLDNESNGSTVPLSTNADTIKIAGQVNSSGDGLSGVVVKAGGKSVVTDMQGYFVLKSVPVSGPRAVVNFEKEGYASYSKVLHSVNSGKTYSINAKMKPVDYTQSIIPVISNTVNAVNKGNNMAARIDIPANALLDNDGKAVSSAVTINVTFGDPTLSADREIFPGDFGGIDMFTTGAEASIESVVFAEIAFFDANGARITGVAHEKPVNIMLSLPESLHAQYAVGDTIPWWSYNDKNGYWVREDADPLTPSKDDSEIVMLSGGLFASAKASHFSYWNCDRITQTSYVKVKVIDSNAKPVYGTVNVFSSGVTYNGQSYGNTGIPDKDGYAQVPVKISTIDSLETAKLFVRFGSTRFYYDVMISSEGEIVEDNINTPELDEIKTLANMLVLPVMGKINVTVIDIFGKPAPSVDVCSDFEQIVTTDENGKAVFQAPWEVPITLFMPGSESEMVVMVSDPKVAEEVTLVYMPVSDSQDE